MDILTLILAMKMSGGTTGGNCRCSAATTEDLTRLLIKYDVLPTGADGDDTSSGGNSVNSLTLNNIVFIDESTMNQYNLAVTDGKLTMTEVVE